MNPLSRNAQPDVADSASQERPVAIDSVAEERNPVDVLADEFTDRLRRGETPSIEEFVRRLPEQAATIRALFPSIAMMERASGQEHASRRAERRSVKIVADGTQSLGDFRILREIGRGGMGIVYEAVQQSLNRRVALKVIAPAVDSKNQLERFRREAEAAARLHHTNIVPVFGIGEEDGLHYYAMQLIEGVSLNEALESVRRPGSQAHEPRPGHPAEATESAAERHRSQTSANPRAGSEAFNADIAAQALLSGLSLKHASLAMGAASGSSSQSAGASSSSSDEAPPSVSITPAPRTLPRQPAPAVNADPHLTVTASTDLSGLRDGTAEWKRAENLSAASQTVAHTIAEAISEKARQADEPDAEQFPFNGTLTASYFRAIAKIAARVADALAYSHQHGVLHRDIKPSNLMLDRNGDVWVTDFGLARYEDRDGITQTGDIVGTLRYMAPEQFHGKTDARSDICSLGLTLFELLTLRPAYTETRHGPLIMAKTQQAPPSLRAINRTIPADLETITLKACATAPGDRYSSAAQLAEDLRRFLDDRPIIARRATSFERLWRWARRNPAIATLSGATFFLLFALVVVFAVGQYRTSKALDEAQTERNRAETNLTLAIQAFEEVMDNISSRGLGQSLAANVGEEDVAASETVLTTADIELLESLLTFFERFANENQGSTRIDTAAARKRVGDIQQRLGRFTEAEETYRKARDDYAQLRERNPGDAGLLIAQAALLNERGVAASRRGALEEATRFHREARTLLKSSPDVLQSVDGRFELARTQSLFSSIGQRAGLDNLIATFRMPDQFRGDFNGNRRGPFGFFDGRFERGEPLPPGASNNGPQSGSNGSRPDGNPPRGPAPNPDERQPRNNGPQPNGDARPSDSPRPNGEDGPRPGSPPRRPNGPANERPPQAGEPDRAAMRPPEGRLGEFHREPGLGRPDGMERGPRPGMELARGPFARLAETRFVEIKEASDEAISLLEGLCGEFPDNTEYRLALARAWRNEVLIGNLVREHELSRLARDTAIRELDQLVREHPSTAAFRFELADTLCIPLPSVSGEDNHRQMIEQVQRAVSICEELIQSSPANPEYQALHSLALSRQALLYRDEGQFQKARELWLSALPVQQSLVNRFQSVMQYRVLCAQSFVGLAQTDVRNGNRSEAIRHLNEAIKVIEGGSGTGDILNRFASQLREMKQRMESPERPPGSPERRP